MSASNFEISKETLDFYLRELAKEIRAEYGKNVTFEIILVGGAAITSLYSFRNMTTNIGAEIPGELKSVIHRVGDRLNLPDGWLNEDFKKTDSYSRNIRLYSKPYRTFSHVLDVRVIADEYLIAMKLKSARNYKRDMSDIVGIIKEMKESGRTPTVALIKKASTNLYENKGILTESMEKMLNDCIDEKNLNILYTKYVLMENSTRHHLIEFEEKYPNVLSDKNIERILKYAEKTDEFFIEQIQKQMQPSQNQESDETK